MKRTILLAAMLSMLLTAGAPVSAQGVEEAPPPQEYVLEEDGTLVIGGDVAIDCPYEFRIAQEYAGDRPSDPELRPNLEYNAEAVRLCEQNGFSRSGSSVAGQYQQDEPSGDVAAPQVPQGQAAPSAVSAIPTPPTEAVLPATGGPDLLLSASAGGALLMGLSVLGFATRRRAS